VKFFGSKTYGNVKKGILYKEMLFFPIKFAKFEQAITIIRSTTSSKSLVINNTLLQISMYKTTASNSHSKKSNKMQQCIKIYYSIFIWSSTCFGRHTAHHQEPKTALAASGFAYV